MDVLTSCLVIFQSQVESNKKYCMRYFMSIIGHLMVAACIIGIILVQQNWERLQQIYGESCHIHANCDKTTKYITPMIILAIAIVIFYIILLSEGCSSHTLTFTEHPSKTSNDMYEEVEEMRHYAPVIQIVVECYHDEKTGKKSSYNKIITHEERIDIPYESIIDASGMIDKSIFPTNKIVRVSHHAKIEVKF